MKIDDPDHTAQRVDISIRIARENSRIGVPSANAAQCSFHFQADQTILPSVNDRMVRSQIIQRIQNILNPFFEIRNFCFQTAYRRSVEQHDSPNKRFFLFFPFHFYLPVMNNQVQNPIKIWNHSLSPALVFGWCLNLTPEAGFFNSTRGEKRRWRIYSSSFP